MKVGFIGAGNVTGTYRRHLINAGHTIVVSSSRGPETLTDFVADLAPGAIAGTKQQATVQPDEREIPSCKGSCLGVRPRLVP